MSENFFKELCWLMKCRLVTSIENNTHTHTHTALEKMSSETEGVICALLTGINYINDRHTDKSSPLRIFITTIIRLTDELTTLKSDIDFLARYAKQNRKPL